MRSVNKVILIGNVTRDPELRQTQSGQAVCTSDQRKKSSAEYHEVVAWAQLADICSKYVRKGKLLYVEGYLKTRSWDTPEGIRKFKTEVVIQDMIMLEKRKDGENMDNEYVETAHFGGYGDDGDDGNSGDNNSGDDQAAEEEPAAEESPVEETSAEEPAAEEAPAEEAPKEEEPAEKPAAEEAPAEEDSTEEEKKKEDSLIDADLGL